MVIIKLLLINSIIFGSLHLIKDANSWTKIISIFLSAIIISGLIFLIGN